MQEQDEEADHIDEELNKKSPLILLLIDGLGVAPKNEGNIFSQLKLKTLSFLENNYPVILLSSLPGSVNQKYFSIGQGEEKSEEDLISKKELSSLSSIISDNSLKQLKIFESERFAPLTYFFNGLREDNLADEEWLVISPEKTSTKQNKEKSLTKKTFSALNKVLNSDDVPDFITVSLSQIDSLARTASMEEIKEEVLLTDKLLRLLVDKVLEKNARLLICSAFGNAEKIMDLGMGIKDNKPTQNPVPLFFVGHDFAGLSVGKGDVLNGDLSSLPISGSLSDLAPTILDLLSLEKADNMKGINLACNLN